MSSIILCDAWNKIVKDGKTYYAPVVLGESEIKQKTGWEIPVEGDHYYILDDVAWEYTWDNDSHDYECVKKNILSTNKDFLKQHLKHIKLWSDIARWQALNDDPPKNNKHYIIIYMDEDKTFCPAVHRNGLILGTVRFSSYEKTKECIDAFLDRLKEDLNYKQRLDQESE